MGTPSRLRTPPRTKLPSSFIPPSKTGTGAMTTTPSQTTNPSRREYFLFFSHKVNDETVTSLLIELLRKHTENVGFFISEKIRKGEDWRKAIGDHLSRANHLVLVFTDPHENWGWCLYESGFFDALKEVSKPSSRIWCLHHVSTTRPSPLSHLQSIPADPPRVEEWLLELFEESGQPKERYLKIPQLAKDICKLFSDQKPIYSQRSIKISANPTLLSPDDLPDDATVEGDARLMEELFGTLERKTDWKSIKERFRKFRNSADANLATLKEVANAIYCVSKRIIGHPTQGIIFVAQGPKRYRPILISAKEATKDQIDCDFMFVEEAGGKLQNIPKPSEALLTAIRMAVRIRWEIVRPFASDVRRQAGDDPYKLRGDLQTCFNNVFLEAGYRGNFSKGDLLDAFEGQDKEKLEDIMKRWDENYPKIWSGIGFKDMKEEMTFEEVSEEPMTPEDLSVLESALQEVERLNRDFLAMAVARGELLIRSELRNN
jgi:hypothetical protein